MLSPVASAFCQFMDHDYDAMSLGLETLEVHVENQQAASAQLSVLRTQTQHRDLLTRKSRPSDPLSICVARGRTQRGDVTETKPNASPLDPRSL